MYSISSSKSGETTLSAKPCLATTLLIRLMENDTLPLIETLLRRNNENSAMLPRLPRSSSCAFKWLASATPTRLLQVAPQQALHPCQATHHPLHLYIRKKTTRIGVT